MALGVSHFGASEVPVVRSGQNQVIIGATFVWHKWHDTTTQRDTIESCPISEDTTTRASAACVDCCVHGLSKEYCQPSTTGTMSFYINRHISELEPALDSC